MLTANVRGRSEETRSKVLSHRQPQIFVVSMIFLSTLVTEKG